MTEPGLIDGRYRLDEVIQRSGMAEVYRGHDVRGDRPVAIKALRADVTEDPESQERFHRESQAAASLTHPSIVAVYDTGEGVLDGRTVPYIVMEYVEGRTLREMLDEEERLPPGRGLEVLDGLLCALEYSHGGGIVHRDVKPGNVMITTSGETKVMDFGIARAIHNAPPTMTQTAQILGTAQYFSPEQAQGERVDARSDVYSAGCVLYELLVGHPPFDGESPVALAYQHVREDPLPPSQSLPDGPQWADALVLNALRKDPGSRYQSAAEMRADVQLALAGQPVALGEEATATEETAVAPGEKATTAAARDGNTRRPSAGKIPRGRRTRLRWPWVLAPVALLLALAGSGGWVLTHEMSDREKTAVEIPWVLGLEEQAAKSTLRDEGFSVDVEKSFTDQQEQGHVYKQRPRADSTRPKSSTVTIFVSEGPATVTVPGDLLATSRSEAAKALEAAGLHIGDVTKKPSVRYPEGTVVSSTPPPGSAVRRGSAVDLVMSAGVATVTVPSVAGKDADDAYRVLRERGLQVETVDEKTTAERAGTVVRQAPGRGAEVEKGARVTIFVARVPEQSSEPSPSPASPSSPGHGHDGDDGDGGGILDLLD